MAKITLTLRELDGMQVEDINRGFFAMFGRVEDEKLSYGLSKTKARMKQKFVELKQWRKDNLKNPYLEEYAKEYRKILEKYCDKDASGNNKADAQGNFVFTDDEKIILKNAEEKELNESDLGVNYNTTFKENFKKEQEKLDEEFTFEGWHVEENEATKKLNFGMRENLMRVGILDEVSPD